MFFLLKHDGRIVRSDGDGTELLNPCIACFLPKTRQIIAESGCYLEAFFYVLLEIMEDGCSARRTEKGKYCSYIQKGY